MKNLQGAGLSRLYLKDTAFQNLMQKRIFNVLLIATPYDAFMLEEDGRVDEQIYFEYVRLNLSSPPRFTKVANYDEAYVALADNSFDLIIAMPGVDVSETFREAVNIDNLYPDIPLVVLTPFSKEVRRRIANEDLRGGGLRLFLAWQCGSYPCHNQADRRPDECRHRHRGSRHTGYSSDRRLHTVLFIDSSASFQVSSQTVDALRHRGAERA